MNDVDPVIRLHADVSFSDCNRGAVLLDERTGLYWMLNPSGTLVLRVLVSGGSSVEAAAALSEEYEVDAARARDHVQAMVESLLVAGVAVAEPAPATLPADPRPEGDSVPGGGGE